MPRRPRIISPSGIYHITLRSINQRIIFEEDADFQKFLFILSDCKESFDIDIYAYCLMNNHIHLLLQSNHDTLSSFFQSFGARFVRWYNNKYSRVGHMFQDRFFSVPIESDEQFLQTLVYIHNNPVEAGICRYPSEYRWSSFNAFYGEKNPLVTLPFSIEKAGSKEDLHHYFASENSLENDALFSNDHLEPHHFLTDENALEIFKAKTGLSSTSEVNKLTRIQRNKYIIVLRNNGLTQKQIARLMDISVSTVKRVY